MPLTDEERNAIVAYRLDKAANTLAEAKNCAEMGHWTLTAKRLYYSAYYASSALLISEGHLSGFQQETQALRSHRDRSGGLQGHGLLDREYPRSSYRTPCQHGRYLEKQVRGLKRERQALLLCLQGPFFRGRLRQDVQPGQHLLLRGPARHLHHGRRHYCEITCGQSRAPERGKTFTGIIGRAVRSYP